MNSLGRRTGRRKMFLKILKWDLKSQRRIFILFLLYVLSIVNVAITNLIGVSWLIGIAIMLHAVFGSLLLITPLVLLAINYYSDFYGKNSYTMHQLAVKTSVILNAKIVSGIIYTMLSVILFIIGSLITNSIFNGITSSSLIVEKMGEAISGFAQIPNYIENVSTFAFWIFLIFSIVIGLFSAQVFYAFIVTLGNSKLLRKLGRGGIVISFLLVYIGTQIISFLTMFYLPLTLSIEKTAGMLFRLSIITEPFISVVGTYPQKYFGAFPIGSVLVAFIIPVLGYIYTVYSLNNKKSIN